ncbi:TonB-dependent receptor [Parahaliea mediterranea]|uniref:TonB-dependent receptor n=1 Tax=Parahaliea mediterranea TaxID=651086 RepID=A0A939IN25_9GAMM|nr:TonB-dependent receptor [Parahaliea mediterranea]MBN7797612.1 TonB-dependent receptor [Parahaliea mediterranea]
MQKKPLALSVGIATLVVCLDSSARQGLIEEVIVTAQKRSESLEDVPISIAVMSSEAMDKTGVRQMREVAEFVPNVSLTAGNDTNTAVRIRGVGANTRNIGFDTRVGMYLDGVYLGQSPAQNLDILDLERVEIARGPQGTLFGKNTVAGAINMITNKPDRSFMADVRGEYGNLDSYRISAIVNAPLTESIAARLSVSDNHRDGFIKNITTGTEFNERDGTSYRGQLRYQGDRIDVNLAADYLESERVSFFGEPQTDWSGRVYPDPLAPGRNRISNNIDNHEEREVWGVSATADIDLGDNYSLRSITAYRDTDARRIQDSDQSANDILRLDYPDQYEQWSQEIQFISPEGERLQYIAGLYLYDQVAISERSPSLGSQTDVLFNALGVPLAPFRDLFTGARLSTHGKVDTESWALFVNGTYELGDRLTLGFGARYTEEKKSVDYTMLGDVVYILGSIPVSLSEVFGIAEGPIIDGYSTAVYKDEKSYDDFSPTLSLSYAISDTVNIYARYSSAFKSGGFNVDFVPQQVLDSGLDFDTETVDAYEIGLKGTALDNTLRFALAGFQMDFDDYQLNQFVKLGSNLSAITIRNAAKVQSRGFEAEATWYPSAALMLQGSLGYNDAEFDEFPGGGTSRNPGGLGADLSGNKLPLAPEWSAAFAAQYNHPLPAWNAEFVTRVDWTYTEGHYTTEDNVKVASPGSGIPFGYVESYDIFNARIGVEAAGQWSVYLWARNLLDEEYTDNSQSDFFGTIVDFPGDPRTYGIELAYTFD